MREIKERREVQMESFTDAHTPNGVPLRCRHPQSELFAVWFVKEIARDHFSALCCRYQTRFVHAPDGAAPLCRPTTLDGGPKNSLKGAECKRPF